ncbi:MAG TPA: hypothetical protein ACFYD4_14600 [Candidatus Wunengus sp. YC61]|uniref:hypothetical protein n=1 Tax=Candidatus Wunengus sp. YC61 TaxID=3367698 RepID=UPI00402873BC
MLYFRLEELVSPDTFETLGEKAWLLFNSQALLALEELREFFDAPFMVNNWHLGGRFRHRGHRTPQEAIDLKSPHSSHAFMKVDGVWIPKCNAFDCDIKGYTAEEARRKIIANKDNPLLKRIMRVEGKKNWLHFDLSPVPQEKRIFIF